MINLIGKWQIADILQFDEEDGMIWVKASDLLAREDTDEDTLMLMKADVLFEENGDIIFLSPLPEGISQEEIDEAVAAGEITLRDGKMATCENHWKVENGKNMADTGMEGEVLGEKVGPWEEIKELDDSTIELTMFHLKKAE